MQIPRSKIQVPKSKIQVPKSKIQVPSSKIQNPKSKIQVPSSKFQNPSSTHRLADKMHPAVGGQNPSAGWRIKPQESRAGCLVLGARVNSTFYIQISEIRNPTLSVLSPPDRRNFSSWNKIVSVGQVLSAGVNSTSYIQISDIIHPTSDIRHQTSDIRHSAWKLPFLSGVKHTWHPFVLWAWDQWCNDRNPSFCRWSLLGWVQLPCCKQFQ